MAGAGMTAPAVQPQAQGQALPQQNKQQAEVSGNTQPVEQQAGKGGEGGGGGSQRDLLGSGSAAKDRWVVVEAMRVSDVRVSGKRAWALSKEDLSSRSKGWTLTCLSA